MTPAPPPQDYGAAAAAADDDDVEEEAPAASSSVIRRAIDSKVPLSTYVWHSHSVLGMTVPSDHLTPVIAAGPCPGCDVDPNGLTRRRRIFLFLMVFFASSTLAVQVGVGHHGKFYAFCAMAFLVLPLVCHLKEHLPAYSKWFMDKGIGPFGHFPGGKDGPRIEEVILLALFVYAPVKIYLDEPDLQGEGMATLEDVLWLYFLAIVAEAAFLVFAYYCGKYCCCCLSCCVPNKGYYIVHHDDDDEKGEDAEREGKDEGSALIRPKVYDEEEGGDAEGKGKDEVCAIM